MSRTGENIYKRKDGRWEGRLIVSYEANGKAKYKYLYAKTYGEVKSKLLQAVTKKEHLMPQNYCHEKSNYSYILDISGVFNATLGNY